MMLDDFLSVFKQVVNEFRILNEHFDSKSNSKTMNYDIVFSSWLRDMSKRYHELLLSMHWGTSSPVIMKNEILFDVRYKEEYFFEVKYKFDPAFVATFVPNVKGAIERYFDMVKRLKAFNRTLDLKANPKTEDYEKLVSAWKKDVYETLTNTALDFHWGNNLPFIAQNPLYFSAMYKDEVLCEMRLNLMDDEDVTRPVLLSDKDDDFDVNLI